MGKHVIYSKEVLQEAVENSTSVMGVLRYLKRPLAGGTHAHISKRIKFFELNTSHFTGQAHNKNKVSRNRKTASELLVDRSITNNMRRKSPVLKRALLEIQREEKCAVCKLTPKWQNKKLVLQIDHINGNWLDDRAENLRFLCPNCHSQTETFSRRRTRTGSRDLT